MRTLSNGQLEVVLDQEHGFIRRTVYEEAVGRSDALLQKLAADTALSMKAIASVDGCIISAAAKAGIFTVWATIPGIKITGNFRLVKDGKVLTPDFWSKGAMQLSLPWLAPEGCSLYFVVTMDKPNGSYRTQNGYIVAIEGGGNVKGWLLPPFANLYEDGRICLGSVPIKCCPTLGDQWLATLTHFNNASFNGDLSARLRKDVCEAQLSFEAATNKQLPVPTNWWKDWARVNSTVYAPIL